LSRRRFPARARVPACRRARPVRGVRRGRHRRRAEGDDVNITVVGDTLLDEDVDGTATRLSPDAPVPVIEIASRVARAGGAGLVARMLAVDGVDVTLVTALGGDAAGDRIRGLLGGVRIVAGDAGAPTPVKTRVRANGLPVARLDE